ncbi:MAG: hypothetical protein KKD63_10460 [Proteobacteria bacterium]|nr:hypothetical protein [Pseudomonadota bacterium]MDP2107398.1 hypothetical protein [Desulfobulbaceae bacterium]
MTRICGFELYRSASALASGLVMEYALLVGYRSPLLRCLSIETVEQEVTL